MEFSKLFNKSKRIDYSISNQFKIEDQMKDEIDLILKFFEENDHIKLHNMFKLIDGNRYKEYIKYNKSKLDELYNVIEKNIKENEMECVDEFHMFIFKNCGKPTYDFVKFCKKNRVDYKRYIKKE